LIFLGALQCPVTIFRHADETVRYLNPGSLSKARRFQEFPRAPTTYCRNDSEFPSILAGVAPGRHTNIVSWHKP
jgi:hypothetical protein